MQRLARVLIGAVSAGALAMGAAAPAMASNEVKVKIDPLNWQWSGSLNVTKPMAQVAFSVQPGGGPQQIFNTEIEKGSISTFIVSDSEASASNGDRRALVGAAVAVTNPPVGGMVKSGGLSRDTEGFLLLDYSFSKQTDPADGKDYYELKFFMANEAPSPPASDLALQNLHETQSEGVAACDVARTLAPGDELVTGDANDTVCVTVDDGGDSSNNPIKIDTGDGNDTVLVAGDTGASVEVDTGRGNDVVVADTDADVNVTSGDGHDAAVDGGNTSHVDASGRDGTVTAAPADDASTDSGDATNSEGTGAAVVAQSSDTKAADGSNNK